MLHVARSEAVVECLLKTLCSKPKAQRLHLVILKSGVTGSILQFFKNQWSNNKGAMRVPKASRVSEDPLGSKWDRLLLSGWTPVGTTPLYLLAD